MAVRTMGKASVVVLAVAALGTGAQEIQKRGKTSYLPVDQTEPFASVFKRMTADKPAIERRHQAVLEQRYDLSNRPAKGAAMSRGKPIPVGPATRLPERMTWEKLAGMSSDEIRDKGLFS